MFIGSETGAPTLLLVFVIVSGVRTGRRVDPERDCLRLAIIVVNHDLGGAVACKRALDFPDGRIYVHFRRIVFDCHVPTSLRIAEKQDHAPAHLHPVRLQLPGRHILMAE